MQDKTKSIRRPGQFKKYMVENRHLTLLFTIVAIWLFFHWKSGGLFLSARNMGTLFLQVSILGFVAVGVVSIMITRGIDLSVASTIGFLTVIGSMSNIDLGLSPVVTCLVMLAVAMVVAVFYGGVVAYLGVPAFIVTLAGQLILKGFYLIISRGEEHAPVDEALSNIAKTWLNSTVCVIVVALIVVALVVATIRNNQRAISLGLGGKSRLQMVGSLLSTVLFGILLINVSIFRGLPLMFVIMMAWAAVVHVVLTYTPFGRHIYAVGANPEAARLAGINPKRIVFLCFLLMGIAYFLSSVGTMARVTGFAPGIASNMELDAIAACVIGGTIQNPCYGDQKDYVKEVIDKSNGKFIGIGMIEPRDLENLPRQIDDLIQNYGFKGIKMEIPDTPFILDAPEYDILWKKVEENNCLCLIDLGWGDGPYDFNIDRFKNVMLRHPDMKTVLCHIGVSKLWDKSQKYPFPELQKTLELFKINKDHLWMDVSAMYHFDTEYPYPRAQEIFKLVVDTVGTEKLMWGSDFPTTQVECTYKQCITMFTNHIDYLTTEDWENLMYKTALKVYFDNKL